MTTRVVSTVITPNVHRARISVQDKNMATGEWLTASEKIVELGETYLHDTYITDTRRIVIEEVPMPAAEQKQGA